MKKWIAIVLAAAAVFSTSACGKAPKNADNPYRVSSFSTEYYSNGELTQAHTHIRSYNEAGHLASEVYLKDGEQVYDVRYETDAYGNVLREVIIYPDGTQNITENQLTLDEQNRVIFEEVYTDGQLRATSEMAYDEAGNQTVLNITRIGALNGEDITSWTDMQYDDDGNMIREDVRWSNSDDGGYILFTYKKGKLVRQEEYGAEGLRSEYSIEYSYDKSGLVETQRRYDGDGTYIRFDRITYDEHGNALSKESGWSEEGELTDDTVDMKYTYTYELIPSE